MSIPCLCFEQIFQLWFSLELRNISEFWAALCSTLLTNYLLTSALLTLENIHISEPVCWRRLLFFCVWGGNLCHVYSKCCHVGCSQFPQNYSHCFKNKIPQCQCPNHPGRQETSVSVPPERHRYSWVEYGRQASSWETETNTNQISDLLCWDSQVQGGVFVVTEDPAEAQPIQEELNLEGSPWVSWQLLPHTHAHL